MYDITSSCCVIVHNILWTFAS